MIGLSRRLWQFQKERFPLAIIISTTLAVIGSSWVISQPSSYSRIVLVFFIAILFVFHMRLFDEIKDHEHDKKNYPNRPVSRGLLTVREVSTLAWVAVAISILINITLNSMLGCVAYLIVLGYHLLTYKEFFVKKWIRRRFFLYNTLHILQLFMLQIYIYLTLAPVNMGVVYFHLGLIVTIVVLMEFARKMRPAENDYANDTYSAKFGNKTAAKIYGSILFVGFSLTTCVMVVLQSSFLILLPLAVIVIFGISYAVNYAKVKNTKNSQMVLLFALLFYIVSNVTIILGGLNA